MTKKPNYDVIVVGAGPGGSVTALQLAKQGFKVLLVDKQSFPRDKSCGDGLTRMSAKLLDKLGLLSAFENVQIIHGVKISIENQGSRHFEYPKDLPYPNYGMVIQRIQLDATLCKMAVRSGAILRENIAVSSLIYDITGTVTGVKLDNGEEINSNVVIAADGSASKIAYEAKLASTPRKDLGYGIRGYFSGISGLNSDLEIYMPIHNTSSKTVLPSYGWVFPLGNGRANIGVGLPRKSDEDNVRTIMDRFIEKLRKTDERFKDLYNEDKYFGAPMRFDFSPNNSFAPGLMLVGDAAGMISPFTGEGISYAIESGMIAADVYGRKAKEGVFTDLSVYGEILASKFQGYFEMGSQTVSRFHFVWQVLKDTFQKEKPLYEIIRQATVFPEGIGESFFNYYTEDISGIIAGKYAELRTDMLSISERLISITRNDWPFISRMFSAASITPGLPFRPSLFLLLAGYMFKPDREKLVRLGTALELGYAAVICHNSIIEQRSDSIVKPANWGNMLSVLVGDFLLSKSYELAADLESKYSVLIADSVATSFRGYLGLAQRTSKDISGLSVNEYLELLYLKNSCMFELSMYLGCLVSTGSIAACNTMKTYGKHFGAAYQILDETWQYSNKGKNIASLYSVYLADESLFSLALLLKLKDQTNRINNQNVVKNRVIESEFLNSSLKIAESEMDAAIKTLDTIPEQSMKKSFVSLAKYVIMKSKEHNNKN